MESLSSPSVASRTTFTELPEHSRASTMSPASLTPFTPTMSVCKDQGNMLFGSYLVKPQPRTCDESMSLEWAFGLNTDYKAVLHNLSSKTFNTTATTLASTQHGNTQNSTTYNKGRRSLRGAVGTSNNSISNINKNATNTMPTMSREIRKVFYAIGHIGVLYDVMNNTQRHLLGHTHTIIASSATFNKRFVATIDEGDRNLWNLRKNDACIKTKIDKTRGAAVNNDISCDKFNNGSTKITSKSFNGEMYNDIDSAMNNEEEEEKGDAEMCNDEDNMMYSPEQVYKPEEDDGSLLIIWDTVSCLPVQTIPIGKFGGASCVAISADGLYVAVINRRTPQQLIVWGWTAEESKNTILTASKKWMYSGSNKNVNTLGAMTSNTLTTRERSSTTNPPYATSKNSLSATNTTLPSTQLSHGKNEEVNTDKLNRNVEMTNIHDKGHQGSKSESRSRKGSYANKSIDPSDDDEDEEEGENNELHVLWPEYVRVIPSNDVQVNVHFAIENAQMLCTNGKRRVFFWSWSEGLLKYYSPPSFRSNTRKPSTKRNVEHQEQTQHINGVSNMNTTSDKNGNSNNNKMKKKQQKLLQEKQKHDLHKEEELEEEEKKEKHHLTQTILIPGTSMAAGGSSSGHLILWEVQPKDRITKAQDKTLLKTIHAHSNGVNCLTYQNGTIVTGGNDGHVKFFDLQLRMVAWFDALCAGPIYSISFDRATLSLQESIHLFAQDNQSHLSRTGADAANAFCSPNFMIATSHAMIIDVPSASFHAGVRSTLTKGRLISQGQDHAIKCVSAHPSLPRVAIAGLSGQIHLWDYVQKRVLVLSLFKQLSISCLLFDPAGTYLAVGCTSGQVKFLNAETLEEIKAFRPKRVECVSKMCFSADSRMMAVGTTQGCVGLYEYKHPHSNHIKPMTWEFIGFHKTHRGKIVGLQFGHNTQGELIRLLSIGADKRLIEYNLVDSHTETGLLVRTAHKITQGPLPTGFLWTKERKVLDSKSEPRRLQTWSKEDDDNLERDESEEDDDDDSDDDDDDEEKAKFNDTGSSDHSVGDQSCTQPAYSARHRHKHKHRQHNLHKPEVDYLLIATNDYKIKVYQSDWNRQCVKTLLSPTFGGPVEQMAIVTSIKQTISATNTNTNKSNTPNVKEECYVVQTKQKWLVYCTAERVMGLMQLPLVGDPCASTGLIAHPVEITSMTVSYDGQYVFTTGGTDQSMMQWRVNGFSMDSALSHNNTYQESNKTNNTVTKSKNGHADDKRAHGEVPLDHLLCMIDGGAAGEMVKEIIDYFYYAQVRAQGEITTAKRELLGAVHFSQLPHLFRALGYYPSELEMGHLAYEVANMYSDKSETLAEVDVDAILLNFAQFVRLYVNHRPLKGITQRDIEQAFMNIAQYTTYNSSNTTTNSNKKCKNSKLGKAQIALDRNKLFELLSTLGEPLKNSEISAAITSLLGDGVRLNMLPALLNVRQFAENFLGFTDYYHDASDNTSMTSNSNSATPLEQQIVQGKNNGNSGSMSREAFINANVNADKYNRQISPRHSQRHPNHFGRHQRQNELHGTEQHSESQVEEQHLEYEEESEESEESEEEEGLYGSGARNEYDAQQRHQLYKDAGDDNNSDSDVSSEILDEDDDRFAM